MRAAVWVGLLLGSAIGGCRHGLAPAPGAPLLDPRLAACEAVLRSQEAAWNRGELEAFAAGYWKSPDLVFASGSGTRVGFEAMLERYRKTYPDRAAMGQLAFDDVRLERLGGEAVLVRGRWRLTRQKDRPSGRFVLVMRPFPDGWKIVLDYTTRDDR